MHYFHIIHDFFSLLSKNDAFLTLYFQMHSFNFIHDFFHSCLKMMQLTNSVCLFLSTIFTSFYTWQKKFCTSAVLILKSIFSKTLFYCISGTFGMAEILQALDKHRILKQSKLPDQSSI